jgi:hypothetical protein
MEFLLRSEHSHVAAGLGKEVDNRQRYPPRCPWCRPISLVVLQVSSSYGTMQIPEIPSVAKYLEFPRIIVGRDVHPAKAIGQVTVNLSLREAAAAAEEEAN